MDRFLEKVNLPRLNQEEIESMNNTIASTEIEAVIKNLPKNKDHGIQSYHFVANRWGKSRNSVRFSRTPKSMWMLTAATKLKYTSSLEEKL